MNPRSFSRNCCTISPCPQFILRVWVHENSEKRWGIFLVVKSTNMGYLIYPCTCMGTRHHIEWNPREYNTIISWMWYTGSLKEASHSCYFNRAMSPTQHFICFALRLAISKNDIPRLMDTLTVKDQGNKSGLKSWYFPFSTDLPTIELHDKFQSGINCLKLGKLASKSPY